jgi:hypothetical protein
MSVIYSAVENEKTQAIVVNNSLFGRPICSLTQGAKARESWVVIFVDIAVKIASVNGPLEVETSLL